MKWQLVASVIVDTEVRGWARPRGLPYLRKAVFYVKLGPSSDGAPDHILKCSCPRTMVYDPTRVEWTGMGCFHMQKLYENRLEGVTLTEVGRNLFYWRYTTQALSK
jgi:hypothetical protein